MQRTVRAFCALSGGGVDVSTTFVIDTDDFIGPDGLDTGEIDWAAVEAIDRAGLLDVWWDWED